MLIIYDTVIRRFTHGDKAKYNIFSNWLLWLGGKIAPQLSSIRLPDIVVEKGFSALCSQQAYLLQTLAESYGIRTRSVGLNGHVVMEAWFDNDWHLYDPDLEVVPITNENHILSLDELAKYPELVEEFYTGRGDAEYVNSVVNIISSREDNSFTSYPRLALFEWKTNVLFHIEKIANSMRWPMSFVFLFIGIGFHLKSRRDKCVA